MKHLLFFLALCCASCATRVPQQSPERPDPVSAARPAPAPTDAPTATPQPAAEPASPASNPGKAGALSGVGKIFTTPEGSARRHARKLAKASVPKKIGKGSVYAPAALEVVNGGNKPQAPVVNADSGAVVTNTDIGKNKAPVAAGPAAKAEMTVQKPGFPWVPVGVGVVSLLAVGAFLLRKSLPFG